MPNPLQPFVASLDFAFLADRLIATLIRGLFQSGFTAVAHPLVRLIRLRRGDDPIGADQGPTPNAAQPVGPFKLGYPEHAGDMLIYVPRSLESYLIDNATGGYGYSHVAVDCGEVELATGKRVMIEATPHVGVHRSYLDKYGRREFVRIPLAEAGVDGNDFRHCIQDKLGEPYDLKEVFTWGQVDDPAKQICSDLAADCLPSETRSAIVRQARSGKLGRHMVSIHGPARLPLHIFVSPNGFARYFGAPKGHKVDKPDTLVEPRVQRGGVSLSRVSLGLVVGICVAAGLWIGWRLWTVGAPKEHE
jgi:hypothetical protein